MITSIISLALGALTVTPVLTATLGSTPDQNCRVLPGDRSWPTDREWAKLNQTVDGRLIATIPLGSPCHDPTFNAAKCVALKDRWTWPDPHEEDPTSIMMPFYQNNTCVPFSPRSQSCTLGNLPEYSINVSSHQHVAAGLQFAEKNNIRLVIKNTGHDFLGKSTGKGALSLWMHGLRSINVRQNYTSRYYNGPSVQIGAGVRGLDVYPAVQKHGLVIVGGNCPSVGLAGGFTQGGGHSSLSSTYGMGADQVLEWEVVTADGKRVIATPDQNSDLYWALSGGGGGTYAVVISLTVRAFPDGRFGGASVVFGVNDGLSKDKLWAGFSAWQKSIPALLDAGATAAYLMGNDGFYLMPLNAPGRTESQIRELLKPFITTLDSLQINYNLTVTSFTTYLDHYSHWFGPLPWGPYPVDRLFHGHFIPRKSIETNNNAVVETLRNLSDTTPVVWGFVALQTSEKNAIAPNALSPRWRRAAVSILAQTVWDWTKTTAENAAGVDVLVKTVAPALEAVTPGAGGYLNEGSWALPSWKEDYYGGNYEKLKQIKKKYDPKDLFYGPTAVGSDAWKVVSDGRLCRA